MLRICNLRKSYGSLQAVADVSLEVRAGEVVGLLGPNGAGKTTTVHIIAGLLHPDSGTVEIADFGSPATIAARRQVGIAPQALAIYRELTAVENLKFFGRIAGLRTRNLRDRVNWALDFVSLCDRANDRVKTYSGGMTRRLNLAIALIHDPPCLLLDEPTAGVDPQSRNAILEKIAQLRSQGRAVLYTTHYMEEAQRLCDRVAIMDRGQLLAVDTVEGMVAAHGGYTLVTADTKNGPIRIEASDPFAEIAKLQGADGAVRIRVEPPNLEAVFLNLTGRHLRD